MTYFEDWRQERAEWFEGSLLDEQDRIDWEHDRNELLGLDDELPKAE